MLADIVGLIDDIRCLPSAVHVGQSHNHDMVCHALSSKLHVGRHTQRDG